MPYAVFVIPGDIDMPTGGYAYDRRVLALLPQFGVAVDHLQLPGSYPSPSAADLAETQVRLAPAAGKSVLLIDGLAYGAMPARVIHQISKPIVALVHHPLCLEAGLSEARQAELRRLETEAMQLAARVVVTSTATSRILTADFGVPAGCITVAEPGTDAAPRAAGSGDSTAHLLAVGSVIPRKGYDILIDALAALKALSWRLDIAGGLDMSPQTTAALRRQIAAHGLAERVNLLGAVDEARLARLYDRADLFVMASHYEGFGMVLTEALARGLPIVCTASGAATETMPDDAALKCQAGDVRALMWVLGRTIEDTGLRKRYADAAWIAAQSLQRWPDTARRIADVIKEVSA